MRNSIDTETEMKLRELLVSLEVKSEELSELCLKFVEKHEIEGRVQDWGHILPMGHSGRALIITDAFNALTYTVSLIRKLVSEG